jgi:hypothetical protein
MRPNNNAFEDPQGNGTPIPLPRWAAQMGRSSATVWRWRKLGWLNTINIAGKVYVPADEAARFNARAAAGEFSKVAVVPVRHRQEAVR